MPVAETPVTAWTTQEVSQECGCNRCRKRSVPTELVLLETVLWHCQAKEGIVEAGRFQYGHVTETESGLVIAEKGMRNPAMGEAELSEAG